MLETQRTVILTSLGKYLIHNLILKQLKQKQVSV